MSGPFDKPCDWGPNMATNTLNNIKLKPMFFSRVDKEKSLPGRITQIDLLCAFESNSKPIYQCSFDMK